MTDLHGALEHPLKNWIVIMLFSNDTEQRAMGHAGTRFPGLVKQKTRRLAPAAPFCFMARIPSDCRLWL
jgi:hypothetical protein